MNELPPVISSVQPPAKPPRTSRLAIIGLVLVILGLAYILLLPWREPSWMERARAVCCLNDVKTISLACAMYAKDNGGRLPRTLDDLKPYTKSTKPFVCLSAKDQTHYSYAFTGANNLWQSNPDVIILREIEASHRGKRTLLYNDGHVEQRKD